MYNFVQKYFAQIVHFCIDNNKSKWYEIYCNTFGILEISENAKKEADKFLKNWLKHIDVYTYLAQLNMPKLKLQILELFHQDYYLQFKDGKWNSKGFQMIQSMVMCHYRVPLKEVPISKEELKIMQELGIVEINKESLRYGKNTDWLLCKEGKLFYLCIEPLYFTLVDCESGTQSFFWNFELFMIEAKEYCNEICKECNETFDEKVFMQYFEWYKDLNRGQLHCHIMGKQLLLRELNTLEERVHNEMISRASDCLKSSYFLSVKSEK